MFDTRNQALGEGEGASSDLLRKSLEGSGGQAEKGQQEAQEAPEHEALGSEGEAGERGGEGDHSFLLNALRGGFSDSPVMDPNDPNGALAFANQLSLWNSPQL